MKPLLPLSYLKSLPLYERIAPSRRVLVLVVAGVLAAFSIALFAITRAQASNQPANTAGNSITQSVSGAPIVTRIEKPGYLTPFARYLAPTPTLGTCDTAGPIEVE